VVRLLTGGEPIFNYEKRKDVVGVRWCGKEYKLHKNDFDLANKIATELMDEWLEPERGVAELLSPSTILKMHDMAAKRIAKNRTDDGKKKKRGILMLKETSGCGWWRMVHPANHMNLPGHFVDICASAVEFDQLIEYDIIYVQRLFEWEDFYTLQKLKKAGKRIIYDMDDDFFQFPDHNPGAKIVGKDQQFAARECLRIADVVTTTTPFLAQRIRAELEEDGPAKEIRVIPNALDPTEPWLPTDQTGSPDGNLRIFWQGSATHALDWHECINAIDTMMTEFTNLRLVILGFLPPVLQERVNTPLYQGRIEFMPMQNTETYFQIIKHIRADAGIAPLSNEPFNLSKSPIKVIENALIGMPTVASDVEPYSAIIDDDVNGYLAEDQEEWEDCLRKLLTDAQLRKGMVAEARKMVNEDFNIKNTAKEWEKVLVGQ
jgi:glycosyltransferase involved in cell wall biosynthesis